MRSAVILDRRVCLSSNGVHILPDLQIFEHSLVHHKRISFANHNLSLLFLELEVVSFVRFDKWLRDCKPRWSKRCSYIWYKNIFINPDITPCYHPSLFEFKRMVWSKILSFLSSESCFCLVVHCHIYFWWLNAKIVGHAFRYFICSNNIVFCSQVTTQDCYCTSAFPVTLVLTFAWLVEIVSA